MITGYECIVMSKWFEANKNKLAFKLDMDTDSRTYNEYVLDPHNGHETDEVNQYNIMWEYVAAQIAEQQFLDPNIWEGGEVPASAVGMIIDENMWDDVVLGDPCGSFFEYSFKEDPENTTIEEFVIWLKDCLCELYNADWEGFEGFINKEYYNEYFRSGNQFHEMLYEYYSNPDNLTKIINKAKKIRPYISFDKNDVSMWFHDYWDYDWQSEEEMIDALLDDPEYDDPMEIGRMKDFLIEAEDDQIDSCCRLVNQWLDDNNLDAHYGKGSGIWFSTGHIKYYACLKDLDDISGLIRLLKFKKVKFTIKKL
jgi:hypothetical protein